VKFKVFQPNRKISLGETLSVSLKIVLQDFVREEGQFRKASCSCHIENVVSYSN
jgi:hypothetical protein